MQARARTAFALATLLAGLLAGCGQPASVDAGAKPRASTNPYAGDTAAIAAGAQLYATRACSACHGADAGGGMGPSLRNDVWIYGSDDATLFDLVRSGSVAFRARGHERRAREPQHGDMPPLAGAVDEDELWKILAWVRSPPL